MNTIAEFIKPRNVLELTEAEHEQLLDLIRDRRMKAFVVYQEASVRKNEINEAKARAQMEKKVVMLDKAIQKAIKIEDELHTRITQIRALRLELGLEL